MELTFINDLGQSFVIEIDPNMELENVMALLEAEVCCSSVITYAMPIGHGPIYSATYAVIDTVLITCHAVWHSNKRAKHIP